MWRVVVDRVIFRKPYITRTTFIGGTLWNEVPEYPEWISLLGHPVRFNTSGARCALCSAASRARNNSFFIVCGIVSTIHLTTTGSIISNVGLAGRIAAGTEEPSRRPMKACKNTHTSCDGTGRHDCDGAASVIANTTTSAATASSAATAASATAASRGATQHPPGGERCGSGARCCIWSRRGGHWRGGTTVVHTGGAHHTGSAHRSGSAHHQAKPHKTGKSRR